MPRILVIDDDDQVRAVIRLALERAGYDVEEACDGEAAIKRYRADPADLIITDIVMPGKEGLETIMELRKDFPDVKIIAISGGGRLNPQSYLDLARKLGAFRSFSKPVARRDLLEAVSELLGEAPNGQAD
jgi:CheY-like chemotaxis protein